MLECWRYLVLELLAIDGCAAASSACWVPTLDHEAGYDAVEDQAIEVVALSESGEVLARFWRVVVVELDYNRPLQSLVVFSVGVTERLTTVVSTATSVAILKYRETVKMADAAEHYVGRIVVAICRSLQPHCATTLN